MSAPAGVRLWIASLCFLVFAMVVVGGVTRLTRSGLSIVEWRPVAGVLPPLSDADWNEAFAAYQQFPEYKTVNAGMTLPEFKQIFFWEYLHRLIGRLTGLVLGVPLVVLLIRRRLTRPLVKRLIAAFALGGLQGLLGWYMVKSGLVNVLRVSHYRLAAHLSLAFFLFVFLFWTFLDLRPRIGTTLRFSSVSLKNASLALTGLIALQIVYGAFVAGMHAGYGFNTFPLMNDGFLPPDAFILTPALSNLIENPATVQFIHRMIAWTLALSITAYWWRVRAASDVSPAIKHAANALLIAVLAQFSLGVATLLLVVPVPLAALHQVGAFALLSTSIYGNFLYQRATLSAASTP